MPEPSHVGWPGSALAYRVDHDLNIVRVGVGGDAMPKVEDMRAVAEGLADPARGVDQRPTARHHMAGRKVALHATVDLHILSRPFRRHRIVNGDAIGTRGFGKAYVTLTCLTRKGDMATDWNGITIRKPGTCRRVAP